MVLGVGVGSGGLFLGWAGWGCVPNRAQTTLLSFQGGERKFKKKSITRKRRGLMCGEVVVGVGGCHRRKQDKRGCFERSGTDNVWFGGKERLTWQRETVDGGGTGHNDSDVAGSVWPQWGNIPSTEGVWGWATSQWATPPSALAYTLHFKEGSIYQLPKCIFYTYRSSHAGELCDFIELLNVMHICSPAFEFACFFNCFFFK